MEEESSAQTQNEKNPSSIIKIFELLSKGDPASIKKADVFQHFTSPPPRYTEASLVKALDENGIGRPYSFMGILDFFGICGRLAFSGGVFVGNIV